MTVTFVNGQSYTTSGVSLEEYLVSDPVSQPWTDLEFESVFKGR